MDVKYRRNYGWVNMVSKSKFHNQRVTSMLPNSIDNRPNLQPLYELSALRKVRELKENCTYLIQISSSKFVAIAMNRDEKEELNLVYILPARYIFTNKLWTSRKT